LFLVGLNTLTFLVRGISPITNRPDPNGIEDKWMNTFDNICMIFYSISDALTAFGITFMFYQIGIHEYETNVQKQIQTNLPLSHKRDEVWKSRLGHENFKNSDVDAGGDLSKLCESDLPDNY
jgi:hypothetical protein